MSSRSGGISRAAASVRKTTRLSAMDLSALAMGDQIHAEITDRAEQMMEELYAETPLSPKLTAEHLDAFHTGFEVGVQLGMAATTETYLDHGLFKTETS